MQHSAEMKRCLVELDVAGMRKLSAHVSPHLPQPRDDRDTLVKMHLARTQMSGHIEFKLCAYSHRFLTDNGYPSGLPDHLKPKAEQICPRIAEVIGIATKTNHPIAVEIRGAMMDAAINAQYDKKPAAIIKSRMMEARAKVLRIA